jgi:16S rRNA (guanine527-N7)-methyltransferase
MLPFPGDSRIGELLLPYGVEADQDLCRGIRAYATLLAQWNSKVALTTITDPEEVIRFHFGESMFAVSKLDIREGRLADIGTGPGFPGIPIRMVLPHLELTLVESNQKKAAFLSEVVRTLALKNVSIARKRVEDLRDPERYIFDFVTARALGNYQRFLEWSQAHISQAGRVILWLGSEEASKIEQKSTWRWQSPVSIPQSRSRVLLDGRHSW